MKTTAASLLTALALLAVPAASQAAETVGNDLAHAAGNQHTLFCGTSESDTWPCTLVLDRVPWTVDARDDHILTSWSAQLTTGTQARLRLLRRNSNGTYTGAGSSDTITATSTGVHTFTTHLPVPAGDYTIGIDLLDGDVGAIADPDGSYEIGFTDPPIADGATRSVQSANWEMLAGAKAEPDHNGNGKGDETEEPPTGVDATVPVLHRRLHRRDQLDREAQPRAGGPSPDVGWAPC